MKRYSFLLMSAFFLCVLIAGLCVLEPPAEAQISGSRFLVRSSSANPNPGVLPPQSKPFGKSYGEWSAAFWQWVYSMPVDQHPLFDTADCSEGQSGKVWFLGGTYTIVPEDPEDPDPTVVIGEAYRTCTVPNGKALFFPILNAECNDFEVDPEPTEEVLRACANNMADHIQNLVVTIDGETIQRLDSYRVESPLFTFGPLPENNVLGAPEGDTFDSVSDGFYIMLPPLSTGEHNIKFSGEAEFTVEEDGFDFLFKVDIEYDITVGKKR